MACSNNYLWRGEATWFCCGAAWGPCGTHGGGACGNCRSAANHAAWPNASQNCYNVTRPDRCSGEGGIPRRGCGSVMNVRHQCGSTVCVTITDCGPRMHSFCGERVCCGGECRVNRVIDLTPAPFSAIANLSAGVVPVWVYE